MTNLQKRALAAAIYFPLLLISARDARIFSLVMALLAGACWHEYLSFRFVPVKFGDWVFHFFKVFLGALPPLFVGIGASLEMALGILFLFLQGMIIMEMAQGQTLKKITDSLGFYIFGYLYITISFSILVEIELQNAYSGLWFLFFAVALADTGAYFAGRSFGKTPFFPEISPKKTLEGFYGGIVGSVVIGILLSLILRHYDHPSPNFVVSGILAGILGVTSAFGDLFESMIKRSYGVKDSGNLIPGHGGVLDRFDGVMFAAIPLFFFVILRGGFR